MLTLIKLETRTQYCGKTERRICSTDTLRKLAIVVIIATLEKLW